MKRIIIAIALLLLPAAVRADFKITDYGASGNYKASSFCSTTLNSAVVTCPVGLNFQAGDVGKTGWCANVAGNGQPLIAVTTIASRQSTTQVTMSAVANDTQNGSARCAFGTGDSTAAFASAYAAANATVDTTGNTTSGTAGTITIPCGIYKVSGRIYNKQTNGTTAPALVGEGACSTILIAPDYVAPGDGTAMFIQAQGSYLRFANFNVTALGWSTTTLPEQDFIRIVQGQLVQVDNIHIASVSMTNTGGGIFAFRGVGHGVFSNSVAQNNSDGACVFDNVGDFVAINNICSNQLPNVLVKNTHGRTPLTAGLLWLGGISDECGGLAVCTQIVNSDVSFVGATFYTSANGTSISVDGTSTLYLTDANVGAYLYNAAGAGMAVADGGRVISRGTSWRMTTGGPKAVTNSGTFVDGGGNEWLTCTDSGGNHCTTKSAAQLVSGHQPVRQ